MKNTHRAFCLTSLSLACGDPPQVDPADIAIPDSGTVTSETGLIKQIKSCPSGADLIPDTQRCSLGDGTLANPTATTTVTVHYVGWTTDGVQFDSSRDRGETAQFALNEVIPGWTEGVQTMVKEEESRFWIPQDLAYGGRSGAPAGMLVFDIELIDF